MEHTITLTDEQFKALQLGQSITIEPSKLAKWEPVGGVYTIRYNEEIEKTLSTHKNRLAGLEYQTKEQAENAAKHLRAYARQLAWLAEHDDGWIADWEEPSQLKFYVYYSVSRAIYDTAANQSRTLSVVYMSKNNAEKLCEQLNSGIVVF